MTAGNPWFRVWPQLGRGRSPVALAPAAPPEQMKSIAQAIKESSLPSKFVQLIPFAGTFFSAGQTQQLVVKFDSDHPFRMDAVVFQFIDRHEGFPVDHPELVASVTASLPGGRMLTRSEVDPFAFNGLQGGADFIPFRYRFQPNDILELTVRNISAGPISTRGFVYGYKLTTEART